MRTAVLALAIAALASGCDAGGVECGPGTLAIAGECRLDQISSDTCGTNTHFDAESQQCVADVLDRCPDSDQYLDGDGIVHCTCPAPLCEQPLPCPPPEEGLTSACGFVHDLETGLQLGAESGTGGLCAAQDTDGACAVRVRPFEAQAYLADPETAGPLAWAEAPRSIDRCGRFVLSDIDVSTSSSLLLEVDDTDDASADEHVPAASAPLSVPGTVSGLRLVRARRATITAWEDALGEPLSDGVMAIVRFVHGGAPVAGVSVDAAAPVYFSDTDPDILAAPTEAAAATGPNGAVLVRETGATLRPSGGELPAGCSWPEPAYGGAAGVVSYLEVEADCG